MPARSYPMPTPHKPKATTLGEFLKIVRQSRDWSQTDLAKACGDFDQSYISMIEGGRWKKPPLDFVRAFYKRVLTNEEKAELMLVLYSMLDDYIEA